MTLSTSILSYSLCVPNHFTWIALYSKKILTISLDLFPIMLNITLSSPTKLALLYTFFNSLKFLKLFQFLYMEIKLTGRLGQSKVSILKNRFCSCIFDRFHYCFIDCLIKLMIYSRLYLYPPEFDNLRCPNALFLIRLRLTSWGHLIFPSLG